MLTLVSTRVGGGVVGVPYATDLLGYVFSLCFQIVYVPVGILSCWMLLQAKTITGRASLSDLGIYAYGNISIYLINIVVALAQLGFPIIFFIVFGDVAGNLIERTGVDKDSFFTSRLFTQSLLGIGLLFLIIKKEIHQLKYGGLVILSFCFIFLGLFFIHYLTSDPEPEPTADLLDTKFSIKFFTGFPTLITSYAFQTTFFTAFASLKNKTNKNGQLADFFGRIFVFIIYTASPLITYGLYGANVEKNLLKSISKEDGTYPVILEIIFLFIPALAIPIIFFIGKEAVLIIFDEITRKSYSKQNKSTVKASKQEKKVEVQEVELSGEVRNSPKIGKFDEESKQENSGNQNNGDIIQSDMEEAEKVINPKEYLNMKPQYYYIVTVTCYLMVLILSITVGDVSIFFGLIGSTAGSFVLWIGPGSFYIIGVHKEKYPLKTRFEKFGYVAAWVYLIFGILALLGLNS